MDLESQLGIFCSRSYDLPTQPKKSEKGRTYPKHLKVLRLNINNALNEQRFKKLGKLHLTLR